MQFKEIIGQGYYVEQMRRAITEDRVSHAQLLSGKLGHGTFALALAYVQYLLCHDKGAEDSCGVCSSCVQCQEMMHPDVHFVMPVNKQGKKAGHTPLSEEFLTQWRDITTQSGGYFSSQQWFDTLDLGKTLKGIISAKEADGMVAKLSMKSYSGGYKVMMIWLPEMMNEQAANKILKILEEPFPNTLFLLICEQPNKLLATIRSRVQEITLPPIEHETLVEWLSKNTQVGEGDIASMARLSEGDFIELKDVIRTQRGELQKLFFEQFSSLMRLSYNDKHMELIEWAERSAQLPREAQTGLLKYMAAQLREAYINHAGAAHLSYLWGDEAAFSSKFAPFIGNQNIESLIAEIERAILELHHNINATMLFTHFALKVSKDINRLK